MKVEKPDKVHGTRKYGTKLDMTSPPHGADMMKSGQTGGTDAQEHSGGRGTTAAARQPSAKGSTKKMLPHHDHMAQASALAKRLHGGR